MNAHARSITAIGIASALGANVRRSEHGHVVASCTGPHGPRYIVSIRGEWFTCKQGEKDWLLATGDTSEFEPMTDDECDAADRGDW